MQMSRLLMVLVLPLVMAGGARAEPEVSYPRVTGNGENVVIDYGPGPANNVVGGGPVALSGGSGENLTITYFDRTKTQKPPAGMTPVFAQQGENTEIVWVPLPNRFLAAR